MASDSLSEALDALEACLDALEEGADPDAISAALAQPITAFNAGAKEALR